MRRFVPALAFAVLASLHLGACGDNAAPDFCLAMQCPLPAPPTCTDGATLVVSAFASCTDTGAAPDCESSTSTTNCAELGRVCAAGACHAPGDPCIGETCSTPPAPSCAGDTLTTYDASGTCDGSSGNALCAYPSHTTDCTATNQVCANGACVDRCNGVTCDTPPEPSCSATDGTLTTYAATGTCDSATGQCSYTATTTNCWSMDEACGPGTCIDPCAQNPCTSPPADSCTDATHALEHLNPGTCTSPGGVVACDYDHPVDCGAIDQACDATTGDCADPCIGFACSSPPADVCDADGVTLEQYTATGTCSSPGGTPGCDYGPTPVDCSTVSPGGTCANGACVNVCNPDPCTSPPPDTCVDLTHADIHSNPGVCTVVTGAPSCDYDNVVDCGAQNEQCSNGACVDPCIGFACTTPPAAACGGAQGNVAETFAATGTCASPGGTPTCSYAETDTPCWQSGQTCTAGACTGTTMFVRVQFPATITDLAGTSETVYGCIYIQGVTDQSGTDDPVGANVKVQFGLGTGADPTTWTWTDAVANASYGPSSPGYEANNDEYQATFAIAGAPGTTMSYGYRLSNDGGATWLYGDTGAAGSSDGFTNPGVLQVAAPFFTEYVEGVVTANKAVEIYNPGSTAFSLTGCQIQVFANGNTTSQNSNLTSGASIAPGGVYVLCKTGIADTSHCSQSTGSALWNGNDAVALVCGGTTYDVIGQIGVDPGAAGWGTGNTATTDHTLLRDCGRFAGDPSGSDVFDPAAQWAGYPAETLQYLGAYNCPLP